MTLDRYDILIIVGVTMVGVALWDMFGPSAALGFLGAVLTVGGLMAASTGK